LTVVACLTGAMLSRQAAGQAMSTATTTLQLSVFGGGSERGTGIAGAKNTDVTAGVDLGFLPVRGWYPALELRGSVPMSSGLIDSEKEFLGGVRFGRRLGFRGDTGAGPVRPYADVLVGRGQLTYFGAGLQVPGQNVFYTLSHTAVFSPGGGVEVDVSQRFALKLDAQAERYSTPVTASGHAWAGVVMVGVVYRLRFERVEMGK
jgi:hypothetical protein